MPLNIVENEHAAVAARRAEDPRGCNEGRAGALDGDILLDIDGIRRVFGLGRTAAYELTHRAEFPAPVLISPRCYRWWESEIHTFARKLQRKPARRTRTTWSDRRPQADPEAPLRITGTVRAVRGRKAAS